MIDIQLTPREVRRALWMAKVKKAERQRIEQMRNRISVKCAKPKLPSGI